MIGIKIEFIYLKRESYHKTFFEKFEIVQRYLIIIKELIRILKRFFLVILTQFSRNIFETFLENV